MGNVVEAWGIGHWLHAAGWAAGLLLWALCTVGLVARLLRKEPIVSLKDEVGWFLRREPRPDPPKSPEDPGAGSLESAS